MLSRIAQFDGKRVSIFRAFRESEIKLKMNRSESEYLFNLMSENETHEISTLLFSLKRDYSTDIYAFLLFRVSG